MRTGETIGRNLRIWLFGRISVTPIMIFCFVSNNVVKRRKFFAANVTNVFGLGHTGAFWNVSYAFQRANRWICLRIKRIWDQILNLRTIISLPTVGIRKFYISEWTLHYALILDMHTRGTLGILGTLRTIRAQSTIGVLSTLGALATLGSLDT